MGGGESSEDLTWSEYLWKACLVFLLSCCFVVCFLAIAWLLISQSCESEEMHFAFSDETELEALEAHMLSADCIMWNPTMRSLGISALIALLGFWAGAGASARNPVKSALLASL
jgi:hypothetical protein